MKNKIGRILLAVIIFLVSISNMVYAKETPDELKNLYARSAVLMDADSGRILFGKNENDILPMASTTKIMTCIIALENMTDHQICEVSKYAQSQPKVHLGVREGEKYYLMDILYSLMLESHNDSAVIIAEAIGGTVEGFVELMNRKAKEIGCTNTYFITPNGLDDRDDKGIHSTTASDLALIMRYCIKESPVNNLFLKITREKEYQFQDIDKKRNFVCTNHNAFLDMMDGVLSGKTGFTNDAGYCYVAALERGGRTFIVTLLACGWPNNKGYKWTDTRKLMQYGIDNYEYQYIAQESKTDKVYIIDGIDTYNPLNTKVFASTKVRSTDNPVKILIGKNEQIEEKIIQKKQLSAPVKKNQRTGWLYYMLDGKVMAKEEIITADSVEKRNVKKIWEYVVSNYILLDEGGEKLYNHVQFKEFLF